MKYFFLFAFSQQCGTINDEGPNEGLTERSLQDAQRLYLMNDVVQPESVDPLVMQDDVRFSNLVVDIVQGMNTLYHVMYISTGQVFLNKKITPSSGWLV